MDYYSMKMKNKNGWYYILIKAFIMKYNINTPNQEFNETIISVYYCMYVQIYDDCLNHWNLNCIFKELNGNTKDHVMKLY